MQCACPHFPVVKIPKSVLNLWIAIDTQYFRNSEQTVPKADNSFLVSVSLEESLAEICMPNLQAA